jgi:CheY-like chemotaxis protein
MDPWRWVDPRVNDVRLDGVRAYLGRRGYVETPEGDFLRFESATERGRSFFVPASEQFADYARSITHFLTVLSEAEDRHPVAILDEILRAQETRRGLRLLWVENHAVFARVAGRQFLSGHDVTLVPTLAAAREALAAKPFDAVLLDHDLDDGKGTSLIESIRELPDAPAVIAVSAHEGGNQALMKAGADAVCGKTKFAQIESVLLRAVEARRTSPSS